MSSSSPSTFPFVSAFPPSQEFYLCVLGFPDYNVRDPSNATKLATKDSVARLTKQDLTSKDGTFEHTEEITDIILANRDNTIFEKEGWARFVSFFRVGDHASGVTSASHMPKDEKERVANADFLIASINQSQDLTRSDKKLFSETLEKQFCADILLLEEQKKKEEEKKNKEEEEKQKEENGDEQESLSDRKFDRLYLIYQHLYTIIKPSSEFSLCVYTSWILCLLGDVDKARIDRNYFQCQKKKFGGRWTVSQNSLDSIIHCSKLVTGKAPTALICFLQGFSATITTSKDCRQLFGMSVDIRDWFFDRLLNPELGWITDGNNTLVHFVCRAFWVLIANHSESQMFFCGSSAALRQKTLSAICYLGNKISIKEESKSEDEQKKKERNEIKEAISKKREAKENFDEEKQKLAELEKTIPQSILRRHYYPVMPPKANTKDTIYNAVYEYTLLQYCITEHHTELKKCLGGDSLYRRIFERIAPVLDRSGGAEWFFQTLTHIVETVEGGRNFGTQEIRQILYNMRTLCTYDNVCYYYFACLCKLAKQTKESQRLFGSIEIRDALYEVSDFIKKPSSAQWLFTAIHRMIEGSREQAALFATKECGEMAARVGKICTNDISIRWWGMAVGSILTMIQPDVIRDNFGSNDSLGKSMVAFAPFITESLTMDWYFSCLHKLFQSSKMVLGRFCTEEMRDAIHIVGAKCTVQKSKDWFNVVKDMAKAIPAPPTDPLAKKKHGRWAGKILMDDDLDEDEANDIQSRFLGNKSTLAWVKKPIKF